MEPPTANHLHPHLCRTLPVPSETEEAAEVIGARAGFPSLCVKDRNLSGPSQYLLSTNKASSSVAQEPLSRCLEKPKVPVSR